MNKRIYSFLKLLLHLNLSRKVTSLNIEIKPLRY